MQTIYQKASGLMEKGTQWFQRLFAVMLLVSIGTSHLMVPTAHAGFLNWFGDLTQEAAAVTAQENINKMFLPPSYASVTSESTPEPAIVGNAVVAWSDLGWETSEKAIRRQQLFSVSAYNSLPNQTDDSPFITASNTHVRYGIVATNVFRFGTRVKIPNCFGDTVFTVEDRMNSRYNSRAYMDVWMADYKEAVSFGRRQCLVEVLW